MKSSLLLVLAASLSTPFAYVISDSANSADSLDGLDLASRFEARADERTARRDGNTVLDGFQRLFKRKGGGGRSGGGSSSSGSGSRGGSSSSSSGSRGGSSSSSSSSRSGSSSSSSKSGSVGKGSTTSNSGGRTTTGSGTRPAYGGGTYYGGGASVPYRSGQTSPSGISPLLLGAGIGAVAFWPGLWYHPFYYYPYSHPHSYYNHSSKQNETTPVACACDETVVCGCDENTNATYFNDILGNGSYSSLNQSVVNVADVNGTKTILINGTLENGTTASGGTEDPNAAGSLRVLLEQLGWWPVAATVLVMVYTV